MFKEFVLSHRPIIPVHDSKKDNTEEWKAISAKQKGFDLCLALFETTKE